MKVLVACEESQAVCIEFRKLEHEAYSCDILPCSGGHPEWHLQMDVFEAIKLKKWDKVISFQPCTDIAVSGAAWFKKKREDGTQEKSIRFFFEVWKFSNCSENPVGILNGGKYIKSWFPDLYNEMTAFGFPFSPSQIIEPYYFGDAANKKTCLWLRNLPLLKHDPINYSEGSKYIQSPSGRSYPEWCWKTGGGSGKIRSKTFPGIASAMAEQWG
jgi:hypothetical protein